MPAESKNAILILVYPILFGIAAENGIKPYVTYFKNRAKDKDLWADSIHGAFDRLLEPGRFIIASQPNMLANLAR